MLSPMKACITNWRTQFNALYSKAITRQFSNLPALLSRNEQALKLKEMDCTNRGSCTIIPVRGFHVLQQGFPGQAHTSLNSPSMHPRNLLDIIPTGTMQLVRTTKNRNKKKVFKYCKDCYLTSIKGELQVLCKTHPRHKQKPYVPHRKSLWVLYPPPKDEFGRAQAP